ncbi:MAG TPA: PIN domain-containing protein [Nitrospirae bacterium]|nr:PIN domain-containing protein [Nitrospirota bacterium]
MRIYLDNCCFNRPFDDQSQLRIRLECEAKLKIQEDIRSGLHQLIWSYILDYENSKNPFQERVEQIARWRAYSEVDIEEDAEIVDIATQVSQYGVKKMDSLHLACAIKAKADYFLTTDDEIMKKDILIQGIRIIDPIGFIKEVLL